MSNAPSSAHGRSLRFTVGAMLLATPGALSCNKRNTAPPIVNEGPQTEPQTDEPTDETPTDAPDDTPTDETSGGTTEPTTPDRPVVTSINPGPQTPPKPSPRVMVNPGPSSPPPPSGKPRI